VALASLHAWRCRLVSLVGALALLGVSCGPTSSSDIVVALAYVAEGFPMGLATSQGFALHLFESPSASQGFKTLPPDSGARRYYDELTIAGATFRVITEATNPPRFYLDANRNGDLTDDPGPFVGERPGFLPNFYTLKIPYPKENVSADYRLWLFPSRMGGVRFYAAGHAAGELALAESGKRYRIVLFDANADGDYTTDPLIVDVNGDGRVQDEERLTPGKTVRLDGGEVRLQAIAPSGRSATFSRP
jgi:hypothetical protein